MLVLRGLVRLLKYTSSNSPLYQSCSLVTSMEGHYWFQGVRDRYSGITVSSSEEPVTARDLEQMLQASLDQWRKERVRGVWFRVDLRHADWVPVLAKHGFTYHHAKTDFVMMVRWLPVNEPNNIPRYAHTLIGVGAFVVNDKDELLVVQERFYSRPHWKLPGGYVEINEDLGAAAVREVKEETGIEAEFVSLVAFRHVHNAAFHCSDMYFIVHMRPITNQIVMCKKELSACEWMKIERYINSPKVNKMNRFFAKQYLESCRKGVQLQASPMYHPWVKRNIMVYSIGHELHPESNSDEVQAPGEGHSACNGDPKL
ncbi:hypothetical protein O3P69_000036 [Scylla paramamosain]|uniref:Nudix hydrolase domain-containing protein n=2 Tax=Scylla paramamosain TaxID=85552 RepID=A0AAW0UU72_SCYPA